MQGSPMINDVKADQTAQVIADHQAQVRLTVWKIIDDTEQHGEQAVREYSAMGSNAMYCASKAALGNLQ